MKKFIFVLLVSITLCNVYADSKKETSEAIWKHIYENYDNLDIQLSYKNCSGIEWEYDYVGKSLYVRPFNIDESHICYQLEKWNDYYWLEIGYERHPFYKKVPLYLRNLDSEYVLQIIIALLAVLAIVCIANYLGKKLDDENPYRKRK